MRLRTVAGALAGVCAAGCSSASSPDAVPSNLVPAHGYPSATAALSTTADAIPVTINGWSYSVAWLSVTSSRNASNLAASPGTRQVTVSVQLANNTDKAEPAPDIDASSPLDFIVSTPRPPGTECDTVGAPPGFCANMRLWNYVVDDAASGQLPPGGRRVVEADLGSDFTAHEVNQMRVGYISDGLFGPVWPRRAMLPRPY